MVKRRNAGFDEDDNDIFQEGESSQQCRTPCSGKTWSSKYDDNDDDEEEEEDDGDGLTHPSKSACDLHQLTWGCGRPVLNEIIRNHEDLIAHL